MSSIDIPVHGKTGATKLLDRIRNKGGAKLSATAPGPVTPAAHPQHVQSRHTATELRPKTPTKRERFIPITKFALIDRLTAPGVWPQGQADDARQSN